jgi:hypothetical protein
MIKGLMGDAYVQVNGGDTSLPYVTQNTQNPIQGIMRVNGNLLEVFDNSIWKPIPSSYATVGLTPIYQQAIEWAAKKMQEEKEMKALAEKHPVIADLVEAVDRAQEQLQMTAALIKI